MEHEPAVTLEVRTGAGVRTFPVPHLPCVVGSGEAADVRLKHPSVREAHAMIRREGHAIVLAPIDAACPVRGEGVDGPRIPLADGMKVQIGGVPAQVRIVHRAAVPIPPVAAPMAPPPPIAVPMPAIPMAAAQQAAAVPFTPYKPSGLMGSQWPLAIALGVGAAFVIGGVYGWLNYYNPIVGILTLLIAGGASYGVGWVVSFGVDRFAIRNPMAAAGIGAGAGALLMAFGWVSFVSVLLWDRLEASLVSTWFECVFQPFDMIEFITQVLLPEGWFSIKSWTPSGVVLFIGWLIEAACFVGVAALTAWKRATRPFDEAAGTWYRSSLLPAGFAMPGQDPAAATSIAPQSLAALAPVPVSGPHFVLTVFESGLAGSMPLIEVERIKFDGKKKEGSDIMAPCYVPPDLVARLRAVRPV